MHRRTIRPFILVSVLISLVLLACDLGSIGGGKPTIVITSPPSGSQFREGEDVAVQSTSTDSVGIARVELLVDGAVVRTDPVPAPQVSYPLIQTWKATSGQHVISVRAINTANVSSDPAAVSISVQAAGGPADPTPIAPTPVLPTAVPPTAAPPTAPGACTNSAAFVSDITVADGTVLAPGQTFNKIWRVRNSGTCTWDGGYQFVFVSGEAMATTGAIVVPHTSPGATADLLVAMTAPSSPGLHLGQWRLRNAAGVLFGPALTVNVNVLGVAPPPSTGCTGAPSISTFAASPATITAGASSTLSWGLVSNADAVEIDHGVGGVATPGNVTVSPGSTTTYTMVAHCGPNTASRQVTVTVIPPLPPPVALVYDFVASAPSATWYSGTYPTSSGYLTWGAAANENGTNDQGFMRWVEGKLLEDNTTVKALETHPKWVTNGFITGRYNVPGTIPSGTRFKAKYGFLKGAGGKVQFVVGVIAGGTPTRILEVVKQQTGTLNSADISLGPWVGQNVQMYIQAVAQNPDAGQDWAVWVAPRLQRE